MLKQGYATTSKPQQVKGQTTMTNNEPRTVTLYSEPQANNTQATSNATLLVERARNERLHVFDNARLCVRCGAYVTISEATHALIYTDTVLDVCNPNNKPQATTSIPTTTNVDYTMSHDELVQSFNDSAIYVSFVANNASNLTRYIDETERTSNPQALRLVASYKATIQAAYNAIAGLTTELSYILANKPYPIDQTPDEPQTFNDDPNKE